MLFRYMCFGMDMSLLEEWYVVNKLIYLVVCRKFIILIVG